ncbi:uncharacterized protein GIQ15_06340 [Arthroderma uncinatum]|uniref:uncharacterized protein n=1 Tax=Arthroderma uncinatum TaxID=74035 RepID=UPI00144A871B|nr:uncharacterized protein GIQ15_06340 [Arthroderma uncinatum]KAF3480993.1 hypothetical protein GIQ15_06340 [Arthroderma uncinatum]
MRWFAWLIIIILLALLAYAGWIVYSQIRARRAGLPPPPWKSYIPFMSTPASTFGDSNYPTPRSGGIAGWFKDRIAALRNKRTHQGAYEDHLEPRAYRGAGGPLSEHDEPWDARMGAAERDGGFGPPGYYEEQELDFASRGGAAGAGAGYDRETHAYGGAAAAAGEDRGRSRSRDPSPLKSGHADDPENPFGDHAEGSNLRSISPRPEPNTRGPAASENPSSARKGAFRESL